MRFSGQGMMTHTATTTVSRYFTKTRGKALSAGWFGLSAAEFILPVLIVYLLAIIEWRNIWLIKNKIVYSPDYLVNSGGVIAIASEINNTENSLEQQLKKIADRLKPVLQESKKNNESTDLVARRMAWKRINS